MSHHEHSEGSATGASTRRGGTPHPHDPLTADEIDRAREILVGAGILGETVRVPMLAIDGSRVDWEGWSMRVDFNAREGLVLHDVTFGGRSVLSRASVPEMVVPYGDTSNTRFWITPQPCPPTGR